MNHILRYHKENMIAFSFIGLTLRPWRARSAEVYINRIGGSAHLGSVWVYDFKMCDLKN